MKECPQCQSCYEDALNVCPIDEQRLKRSVPGSCVLAGKFRLEARLGKGGMGVVYRATHLGVRRTVALKTLFPQHMSDEEFVGRFRREAAAAGQLKHPNVVDVTDFGFAEVGDQQVGYLVMEYLEGETLRDLIRREAPLSVERTVEIMNQVCAAVAEAHKRGIIHRDLKPDNIWLQKTPQGKYQVKVLDFGLAKLAMKDQPATPGLVGKPLGASLLSADIAERANGAGYVVQLAGPTADTELESIAVSAASNAIAHNDSTQNASPSGTAERLAAQTAEADMEITDDMIRETVDQLTQTGAMMGTLPYMSPEQCRCEPVQAASDIYALGIITYEMLTGKRPFEGTGLMLALAHLRNAPALPSTHVPRLPRPVEAAVMRALAKMPQERQASAAEFFQELEAHVVEQGKVRRRLRFITIAAGIIIFALGTSALFQNWYFIQTKLRGEQLSYRRTAALGAIEFQSGRLLPLIDQSQPIAANTNRDSELQKWIRDVSSGQVTNFQYSLSDQKNIIAVRRPDDKRINVTVWDLASKQRLGEVRETYFPDPIFNIALSTKGDRVAIAAGNEIPIYDVGTGKRVQSIVTYDINNLVAFSPDDARIAVASVRFPYHRTNSNVTLYDAATGERQLKLIHDYGVVERLSFAPDGSMVALCWKSKQGTGRLQIINVAQGLTRGEWPLPQASAFAFSPDGHSLALAAADTSTVELYNLTTKTLERRYKLHSGEKITCIGYPSEDQLLVTDTSGTVENLLRGEVLYKLPKGQIAHALANTRGALVEVLSIEARAKN